MGEKETLKSELRKTKEDLGRLAGEKDALAQELQDMREQLGRLAGEKGILTRELQETREQLGRLALPSSPAVPVCFFLPHQPPQLFPRLLQFPCKFSFLPRQPP